VAFPSQLHSPANLHTDRPEGIERGTFAPLRHPIFLALLTAAFASNIGTWMQDVGSSWLMTSLAPNPVMVSLIQTAVNLPFFLLALIAGALADIADRRRILLFAQFWMLASAGLLGVLTVLHLVTPWTLLALSFTLGLGAALGGPGWQAIVPELVERDEIRDAITLNSVQYNFARGVGPAIGGVVVAAWGAGAAFLANASSFVGVIAVLLSWRRERKKSVLPAERVIGAIRAGARYVRYTPALRSVMVRSFMFGIGTSAMWAVLPLVARVEFHLDAIGYGLLVAFFGVGAATAGFVLGRARHSLSADRIANVGGLAFATVNATIATTHNVHILWLATFVAGGAWVAATTMYNSSAQMSLASWVRGRALAMYLLMLQGGLAIGSVGWGYLASRVGIRNSLDCAAIFILGFIVVALNFSLSGAEHFDPKPWVHWDLPVIREELDADRGPVVITIEYRIELPRAGEFERAMHTLEAVRRRDGAIAWGIYSDVSDPTRYLEWFMVETWGEHLRQHYRLTISDTDLENYIRSFHVGPEPPVITHFVAPPLYRS
jgi:MFS family permease